MNAELVEWAQYVVRFFFIAGAFCAIVIIGVIITLLVMYFRTDRRIKKIENKKDQ